MVTMMMIMRKRINITIMRTQVKEASCYGNLANCEAPGQKCCRTTYERVCQQVVASLMMMVMAMTMMMTTITIISPLRGSASRYVEASLMIMMVTAMM